MYGRYHSPSPLNDAKANGREIDAMLECQRTFLDAKARKAYLDRAQVAVAERAYWGYLPDLVQFNLVHPAVGG